MQFSYDVEDGCLGTAEVLTLEAGVDELGPVLVQRVRFVSPPRWKGVTGAVTLALESGRMFWDPDEGQDLDGRRRIREGEGG
jgi:hypothetical protein